MKIVFTAFNIHHVRETIQTLKKGGESLTLTFGPVNPSEEEDFTVYEALNVKGLTLKGKAGQAYWTVGNTFDYDIVLPKLT